MLQGGGFGTELQKKVFDDGPDRKKSRGGKNHPGNT